MTLNWFEQSAGGEVLEWRPHLLSPEMELKDKPYLVHEPSWRKRDSLKGKLLDVSFTPGGLTWTWGEWTRLKLDLFISDGFLDLGSQRQRRLSTETRGIAWEKLPPCDALELTPSDAAGASGLTMQVQRPPNLPWIPFDFHYVSEPRHGIQIVPRRKAWLDRMELSAVALEQIGHGQFERKTPVGLRRDGGFLSLTYGFEGLIAVYGCIGKLRRLLDCTTVSELDERGRPKDPKDWELARKQVGAGACRVRPWPRRSAELQERIREEALAAGIPRREVEDPRNLRGLHRFLVLRACPVAIEPPEKAKDVQALGREDDLRTLLSRLTSPQVLTSLDTIKSSNGRLWVLRNANHPDLAEIVTWAGAAGLSGLERAKELVGTQRTLRRLAEEIRPETTEGREIAKLGPEIDRAPISSQELAGLKDRVADLEARAKASRERKPSAADDPPITKKEYEVWKEIVRQAQQWRAWVDSVLTYCESGDWPVDPGPMSRGEIALGPLAQRARSLDAAVELPRRERAAAEADRLASRLKEVFEHADREPPSGDKQAILDRLGKIVRPDPGRWTTVHQTLRDAAELAKRRPRLAEEVGAAGPGAPAGLGERARRALLFLNLDRELRETARTWRGGIARLVPGGDVEALLATPGHPAIEQAHRECLDLAKRLEREDALPRPPLTAPPKPTLEAFRQWWQQLEALFTALGRLREDLADLEKKIRWARDELLPRALHYLEQDAALPADRRPPDLAALGEAARALAESDGVPTRQIYTRFREAFEQVERFHEQR